MVKTIKDEKYLKELSLVSDRLLKFRFKYNLNQEQAAIALGISKVTINRIEGNKGSVSLITLKKIIFKIKEKEEKWKKK